MSHLTRCAYVSGPYWSVRDRWQIVHVSDTYDMGKMKIKCNLYVTTRNIIDRSKQRLLTILKIDVMIVCRVVIQKLVGFALAKHVKKIVVFGGDLIMEGFKFLSIKGF